MRSVHTYFAHCRSFLRQRPVVNRYSSKTVHDITKLGAFARKFGHGKLGLGFAFLLSHSQGATTTSPCQTPHVSLWLTSNPVGENSLSALVPARYRILHLTKGPTPTVKLLKQRGTLRPGTSERTPGQLIRPKSSSHNRRTSNIE